MAELIPLRETERIFDAQGTGTRRFNEFMRSVTNQVNTSTNDNEDIRTQQSTNQQAIAQITDLLKKKTVIVITDSSLTAKPFETVICTNTSAINITLEINPIKGDIINVKRTDAQVTVIGTIDGVVDKIINVKYWSMKLIYTGSQWVAV
jgi:hypothetical protein